MVEKLTNISTKVLESCRCSPHESLSENALARESVVSYILSGDIPDDWCFVTYATNESHEKCFFYYNTIKLNNFVIFIVN